MKLLLHPTTAYQLEALIQGDSHAILITGLEGTGKTTLAEYLSETLLGQKVENYAYFRHLKPVKQSIGIETVRDLRDFLQRKTTGEGKIRRVIVVSDAHLM